MTTNIFRRFFDLLSHFSAAQITVISFLVMSLIGGSLLWYTEHTRIVHAKTPAHATVTLIASTKNIEGFPRTEKHTTIQNISYTGERFVDTLFTAVSALCVTGLISTDFSQFTLLGQIITMILIQMGGLGIIVFTSILAMYVTRGLSEHASFRRLLSAILDTREDYVRTMIKHVLIYTAVAEGLGALIMALHLQFQVNPNLYGHLNPWWWGLFHAISAFNNAGFGLLNNNITNFATDPIISLTIAFLIILGGLGYPVLIAIHVFVRSKIIERKDEEQKDLIKHMRVVSASGVQTRIAIAGTLGFLALGTFFPLMEATNRAMLSHYSFPQQLLITFFQSASTRTAGFNSIDIGSMGTATLFLYIIFMFVGTNPAGTGGGIKIPTVAVLYGYLKDWFQRPGLPVILMKRKVSKFAVSHAIRLFFLATATVFLITFFICLIEDSWLITPDPIFNFLKILFEVVSAFGTVGLTMGYPGGVTSLAALFAPASKILLIVTMLIGRLGPLTILAALPWKKEPAEDELTPDYVDAQKIQIG